MLALYVWLKSLFASDEGQDLAEYALLIGLIALVVVVAVTALGDQIKATFTAIAAAI